MELQKALGDRQPFWLPYKGARLLVDPWTTADSMAGQAAVNEVRARREAERQEAREAHRKMPPLISSARLVAHRRLYEAAELIIDWEDVDCEGEPEEATLENKVAFLICNQDAIGIIWTAAYLKREALDGEKKGSAVSPSGIGTGTTVAAVRPSVKNATTLVRRAPRNARKSANTTSGGP